MTVAGIPDERRRVPGPAHKLEVFSSSCFCFLNLILLFVGMWVSQRRRVQGPAAPALHE